MRQCSFKETLARHEVSAYVAPARAQQIAHERTDGMVNCFLEAVRGVSWMTAMKYIEQLAESAYLQGVNDAAVAVAKNPEMFK